MCATVHCRVLFASHLCASDFDIVGYVTRRASITNANITFAFLTACYIGDTPGQTWFPRVLQKKSLRRLLVKEFLHAGCPSCRPANSGKALN